MKPLPVDDNRFKELLVSLGDIYFVVDKNFNLIDVNDNVFTILKYEPDALIGHSIQDKIVQFSRSALKGLLKSRALSSHTFKVIDKDGDQVYLNCKIKLEIDDALGLVFTGIARDISDLVNNQRKLKQKTKQILALASAKEQFLANMSHEIRTPLNGIMGLLDLLAVDITAEPNVSYLNTVRSSSATLLMLVNDILDISKIASDLFELRPQVYNLKEIFAEQKNLYSSLAANKGIALQVTLSDSLPENVFFDGVRFAQILGNLVSNGIKFTAKGAVHIQASYVPNSLVQGELRVTVQDTGLGIAEDDANNLFKLFSQLDTTHTKNYGGSGLGLYISKQIVELMGGTISFKSVLGQGTEFFVTIPVDFSFKQADEIATIADQAPDEEALVPTYSFLVVDDNKTNLSVTKALLENLDQKVEVCTNGYSALHRLLTHSYDVVLLDIQMPILDGYGTFALFQTLGTTQRPTIAALTAFAGQADVEALKGAGFDDVLVKPISLLSAKRFLQKLAGFSEPLADRTSATTLLALLLDKEIIQTLVQLIGPDEYCKAMQEFMGELAVLLSGLSDGHENQYKANLHTIKGSAYTLGLQGIGHAAKHYELALAAHDTVPPDEARTVLEHLAMLSVKFASELIGSL